MINPITPLSEEKLYFLADQILNNNKSESIMLIMRAGFSLRKDAISLYLRISNP